MAQIMMELTNAKITVRDGYNIRAQLKARGYKFDGSHGWVLDRSGPMTVEEARDMLLVLDNGGRVVGGETGREVPREKVLAKLGA